MQTLTLCVWSDARNVPCALIEESLLAGSASRAPVLAVAALAESTPYAAMNTAGSTTTQQSFELDKCPRGR